MRRDITCFPWLIIATVCLLTGISSGQPPSDYEDMTARMEAVIDRAVELELFSGCVLVAKDGEVIFSRAVGDANKDFQIKNSLETKFNIGSIGKSFTATAIMLLAQRGLLKVNDPVIKYLPDFPFGDKITIHHLLTHTSGLADYLDNPVYVEQMDQVRSVGDLLPIIYGEKLRFGIPGEEMAYSNSGAVVLGAVIEKVSGQSYEEFLRESVLAPLGMNNTAYKSVEEVVPNRAVGYIKRIKGGFINNSPYLAAPSPAGGLMTTVGDLLLFDQALYGNTLLSEQYKAMMFTPFKHNYAYCWGVFERFDNTVIGHSGGASGINAWFRRYIDDKYTIIVLSNFDGGAATVFFRLEAILFGNEYQLPRVGVGEFLYPLIEAKGIGEVIGSIDSILEKNDYQIRTSDPLNSFGYNLLSQNEIEMAINVFLLNTHLFSDDANTFDSLGDAYERAGNMMKAIESYQKSLLLDPQNTNAEQRLRIIEGNG